MFQNTLTAFAEEGQFLFSSLGNHVTPVTCNVHFGVPGGQGDCVQIGICRVIIDAVPHATELAHENRHCRQAAARVTVNQDGGIDMFFPKEGIMPCTERAIFRYSPGDFRWSLPGKPCTQRICYFLLNLFVFLV
jgi:hypothetical protein